MTQTFRHEACVLRASRLWFSHVGMRALGRHTCTGPELRQACCCVRRGHGFFSANEELLARYAACPGSAEVIAVQGAHLALLQAPPPAPPAGAHVSSAARVPPSQG